jgi:DNA-binding transcriptional MerR regulator
MSVDDRAHLSIGEVLSLLQDEFPDVTISKIRFLESQGLLDPERTPSGYRKFYEPDVARLRWILEQQREHFLPLRVIKERLDRGDWSPDAEPAAPAAGEPAPVGPDTGDDTPAAAEPTAAAPEADATHSAGPAADAATAAARDARQAVRDTPLEPGPASVALSRDELADAAGITPAQVAELERFGLLSGRAIGPTTLYDEEGLATAKLAAGFFRHGVEARHLRMYRVAAEREAAFFQQVVLPLLKQRNPASRRQAVDTLAELAELGEGLRAAMLHHALRDSLGSG